MYQPNQKYVEVDETPNERLEEECNQLKELAYLRRAGIWWAKDIENIKNPKIKQREIEFAEQMIKKENELNKKVESGQISEIDFWAEYHLHLSGDRSRAASRCALASDNLSFDHFAEISDKNSHIAAGNIDMLDKYDRLDKMIESLGTEEAQKLADDMFKRKDLPEDAYNIICRKIRIQE